MSQHLHRTAWHSTAQHQHASFEQSKLHLKGINAVALHNSTAQTPLAATATAAGQHKMQQLPSTQVLHAQLQRRPCKEAATMPGPSAAAWGLFGCCERSHLCPALVLEILESSGLQEQTRTQGGVSCNTGWRAQTAALSTPQGLLAYGSRSLMVQGGLPSSCKQISQALLLVACQHWPLICWAVTVTHGSMQALHAT
jgi:hypothetical protein